jgi:3-oxoacyl-[acyl-carrier protein] reductase
MLAAMDLGLTGRTALVTAASQGIGRAIAAELVAEGARVVISSRSATDATAREIGAEAALQWDSADIDGATVLVDRAQEIVGPLDILVCNTGGPPMGPDALAFTREQWQAAYETLVLAPMALIERALPGMRERGWGRVINVVSTSVVEPLPYLMLSNAHRSSMTAAFKTISTQVAADGVTLNSVLPGRIGTSRLADASGSLEAAQEAAKTMVPAARLGTPEEMAAAAVFLCSDRAGYITGASLAVDGGLLRSV